MQVEIYDRTLTYLGSLQTWLSLEWVEHYNTAGSMVISCQRTETAVSLLQTERYCILSPESDIPMEIISILDDVEAKTVTAWGIPASHSILAQRISLDTVGPGNPESITRNAVSRMAPWPCLVLGQLSGVSGTFTHQMSDRTILEMAEKIGEATDMGFRIRKDGARLLFECYKPGKNENGVFTPNFGNMGNAKRKITISEHKNVALVAGEGEGTDRVTVAVGATSATGAARREMYVDARNIQRNDGESDTSYRNRLTAYGVLALSEAAKIDNIEFDLAPGMAIGDIVNVIIPGMPQVDVRITGKTVISQKNTVRRSMSVGKPIKRR